MPRSRCGNPSQVLGRKSYMVQSLPSRNTQPASSVRFRISSPSVPVCVYCSRNCLREIPRFFARLTISFSKISASVTRQHSAHWRQSIASWTPCAAPRNCRSTKLWDLIQRRNFSFSPRLFSPRRRIWIKSVITPSGYNREEMSDRLYFSCWIQGFSDSNMLRHFGKLLDAFPFSKLAPRGPVVRVYAVEFAEPPLLERPFDPGVSVADLIVAARDFTQPDCCAEIETAWDLWQHQDDWKLRPAAV